MPDYTGYLLTLKEVLEDLLFRIKEDDATGVDPAVSCLEAYDLLEQHLDHVKRELGV